MMRETVQEFVAYEDASTTNESKSGFWGVLARKAKAMLDDDVDEPVKTASHLFNNSAQNQVNNLF